MIEGANEKMDPACIHELPLVRLLVIALAAEWSLHFKPDKSTLNAADDVRSAKGPARHIRSCRFLVDADIIHLLVEDAAQSQVIEDGFVVRTFIPPCGIFFSVARSGRECQVWN